MTTIGLEGLVHVYSDGTRALGGVDLRIGGGERVALVGQNGSGKTTLVHHLVGLLRPTGGRVLLDGEDIAPRRVASLARTVGLAFQDPGQQIFSGSARAEVSFGARNAGLRKAELERAVLESLDVVGLGAELDTNPYDLGYGRRKLLALAAVLAMRTPVVVLDEPTTGQDAPGVERVARIVAALHGEGRTVIAISHDMDFVAQHFDRVVVLREGTVTLDGTPEQVFGEESWPRLGETYLEPPYPARVGVRLGLGSTPRDVDVIEALSRPSAGGR